MDTLWQDIRFGFRMMRKNRVSTVIVVLALALGIGANSAIFSVMNTLLLRPLPFANPERIMAVWSTFKDNRRALMSPANFKDVREQSQSFQHLSTYFTRNYNLTGGDQPEAVEAAVVSANFFDVLGVKAAAGRTFLPEEEQGGQNPVVILSHGLWQRHFGSNPGLLGQTVKLNGRGYNVVGIMPPGINFPDETKLWVPLVLNPEALKDREYHHLNMIGRLKDGVPAEQAGAEINTIASRLAQQYPQSNAQRGMRVISLHEDLVGDIRLALIILTCSVAFILLIACANVANLLLARAVARQREIAVRLALGASRVRLLRQFLTESILIALLSGAVGLLLAQVGIDLLISLSPSNIPRLAETSIDGRVLGFTLLMSLLTGVVFGVAPALRLSKTDFNESLKEGKGSGAGGSRSRRMQGWLVVAEVALSMMLLVGAGLLLKSFLRLWNVQPGFDAQNVITMELSLSPSKYGTRQQVANFYQQLLSSLQTVPNVESVAAVSHLPISGKNLGLGYSVVGRPLLGPGEAPSGHYRAVSPNYFRTMQVPLKKGRDFTERDTRESPQVAIINETLARTQFPNEDPLGKQLLIEEEKAPREIVAVVGDIKHIKLDAEAKPEIYVPYLQLTLPSMALVVRTSSDPTQMFNAVRQKVLSLDPEQPVYNMKTMEQYISASIAQQRFSGTLIGVFALIAVILAVLGIYGVIAYSVSQRSRELGIRIALGATPGHILKLVVRNGMTQVLIGVTIGLAASLFLTKVISSLLYGVSATDPTIFVAIPALFIVVALTACYIPARRATKVDPLSVLKAE